MKLQFLIPQYNEDDRVIKPLLDSIAIQQKVDMDDIGAIIVNDGSDIFLSEKLLSSYPFEIEYVKAEHRGVSATRNAALDKAKADYVCFCDADDMFFSALGLYVVFREIDELGGFDVLVSNFMEETRTPEDKETPVYINREMDSTFVHGKFFKRKYLKKNNIRFNDALTIHEDSYFNCLAQKLAGNAKYCPTAFYLWKWRDESVCRHDPKYILKTYNNMLDSNTALVEELIRRKRVPDAQFYVTMMVYDAYFTMNKDEWINQENAEYRHATELRFKKYYQTFKEYFETVDKTMKAQIIVSIKNRFFQEGLFMETITFDDWIKGVMKL